METKYTYFQIDFENCSQVDYDYTIVEDLKSVIDYLSLVECDLDDDINEEDKPRVIITGIGMTRSEYAEWFKDNVESTG